MTLYLLTSYTMRVDFIHFRLVKLIILLYLIHEKYYHVVQICVGIVFDHIYIISAAVQYMCIYYVDLYRKTAPSVHRTTYNVIYYSFCR